MYWPYLLLPFACCAFIKEKGVKDNGVLTTELLEKYQDAYKENPVNRLAELALYKNDISSIVSSAGKDIKGYLHLFSNVVNSTFVSTSQGASGRCWIFATMNVVRREMASLYDLEEDFELSQAYLYYWDKLEKANSFLERVLETLDEAEDSRIIRHLVQDPVQDGGQWDMIVSLIEKYGIVPKSVYGDNAQALKTGALNSLVTGKLREFAKTLRSMESKDFATLRSHKEKMMSEIHRIVTATLGSPPTTFDWVYRTKETKKVITVKNMNPLSFYKDVVLKATNLVSDSQSLINDPRNDYGRHYTVKFLSNVVAGRPISYLNVEIGTLKNYTMQSIRAGKAVWFGCDVGKFLDRDNGIMSTESFDYKALFGTDVGLDKENRLRFGHSLMTHAMVITGFHVEESDQDKPLRWRVENSWGKEHGDKGYYVMTDEWFDEYVYQVVIEKSRLEQGLLNILKEDAVVLPPWDPMGSLA